jgi:uncharacterized protein YlxW (UPF0749 family)
MRAMEVMWGWGEGQGSLDCGRLGNGCSHMQEARSNQLTQELTKEKSEVSSLNTRVKWAQNKLKTETEAHKVKTTRVQL